MLNERIQVIDFFAGSDGSPLQIIRATDHPLFSVQESEALPSINLFKFDTTP